MELRGQGRDEMEFRHEGKKLCSRGAGWGACGLTHPPDMTLPLASKKEAPRPSHRARSGVGGRVDGGREGGFGGSGGIFGGTGVIYGDAEGSFGGAEDDFGGSGGLFGGAEGLFGGAGVDFRGSEVAFGSAEVAFGDAEGSAFTVEWRFLARGAPRFRPSPPPFRD